MDETGQKPKMGGLADPRLGTIDRNYKCQTCGEGMAECPGHFGHIELARPVFHIGMFSSILPFLSTHAHLCAPLACDRRVFLSVELALNYLSLDRFHG
jgi:DNA-directed RNA polymerase II subunit RPB1